MNRIEIRQYEMLVRVRDFGAARVDLFPTASLAGQQFAGVDAAVTQLREHAVSQMSSRPQRAGTQPTARRALLDALETISRTATAIKAADPAFDNKFHLPRRQPSQALLATGRSFAREAAPVAELFVAHEMPKTFIADLNGLVEALEMAMRAREARKDARTAARVHFKTTLASGLAAVHQLDVLIPNRLKDDPVTLAVWERDRRIEYPARGKDPATSPVAATVVSTPADNPTLPVSSSAVPDDEAA
jgi:hypothetical protein